MGEMTQQSPEYDDERATLAHRCTRSCMQIGSEEDGDGVTRGGREGTLRVGFLGDTCRTAVMILILSDRQNRTDRLAITSNPRDGRGECVNT